MTKERLEEIKDSIDFQLEVAEHIKAVSVIECLNEEKELYNYVIELENMREEILKLVNEKLSPDSDCIDYDFGAEYLRQTFLDILNKTNKEVKDE